MMGNYTLPSREYMADYFQRWDSQYTQTEVSKAPYVEQLTAKTIAYTPTEPLVDYTENPDFELIIEERASILWYELDIPYEWAEAIIKICLGKQPNSLPIEKWEAIQHGVNLLCADEYTKLKAMLQYEWTITDILGCGFEAPTKQYSLMGLIILLEKGSEILEVKRDVIKISSKRGAIQSYTRPPLSPQANQVLIHELH